jgi:uncharacterized zinc-type alcohol dehydrogenase-like protein
VAHRTVPIQSSAEILSAARLLDFPGCYLQYPLEWTALLKTLKPNGRIHVIGATLEPAPISPFDLITEHKSVSTRPTVGTCSYLGHARFFRAAQYISARRIFPLTK